MTQVFSQKRAAVTTTYNVPPLAAYEEWLNLHRESHPKALSRFYMEATMLRRIVMLKRAGDNFAEIGRCCGLSRNGARDAYNRLPEALR